MASSPSPAMVCKYCDCPPRVDPGCPPNNAACVACTNADAQPKGLPGWAIALIVIFGLAAFIGLGWLGHKSGWY